MSMILSWLISSAAVFITAEVLPGFKVNSFKGAMVVAAILGLLQFFFGWILFVAIGLGTLGLGFFFGFLTRVVVTTILLVVTDKLSDSLEIRGYKNAALGALLITLVSTVAQRLL